MNQEIELNRWIDICNESSKFKYKLKKMYKDSNFLTSSFFSDLRTTENSIYGEYNVGYNSINEITLKKIIDIFVKIVLKSRDDYLLISTDGSVETSKIIKSFLSLNNETKFLAFKNFEGFDQKFVSTIIKKIKISGAIHITKSIFQKNILNIYLYDSDGNKINKNILSGILSNIKKNAFDISKQIKSSVTFLNNESLIKLFSDYLLPLFKKNISEKQTRIAISNRSNGITKILSKIIGIQDFSYIVNNNVKKESFYFLKNKHINDLTIKKFFWKEILFAKRKKANFLICFNSEGTQMFLFVLNRSKIFYLNWNLNTLIFLNKFLNDFSIDSKVKQEFFISSNMSLNSNLVKLIKKFKIDFIQTKDFTNQSIKKYMLLFWNDYNQYLFGEKINNEFTIYHLLIKILIIIDYYNNQYSSINAMFNALIKIYGNLEYEDRYNFQISQEKLLENIQKNLQNKSLSKYIVENHKLNLKNEIEEDLYLFTLYDGSSIYIKYNKILGIAQFYLKRYKYKNFFSQAWDNYWKKSFIKRMIKN